MKSIKYKILLSFGITTAFIIMGIGFLISSKLSANIEKQSEMLSVKLSAMTDESLVGYHGVFKSTVNRIMEEVEGIAAEFSSRSDIVKSVEKGSPETINSIMFGYRNRTDKIDFVVLFDLEGNYIASYPSDNEKDINIFGVERFYQSSKLWEKVQKTQESGSGLEKHKLHDVLGLCLTQDFYNTSCRIILHQHYSQKLVYLCHPQQHQAYYHFLL